MAFPDDLTDTQKFEALKMRYQDHVELLRIMTNHDYQIFGGFMTLLLAVASWFTANPPNEPSVIVGILIAMAALSAIALSLIHKNGVRRIEAIMTLGNVMTALGFDKKDFYVTGLSINYKPNVMKEESSITLWAPWYIMGILVAYLGFLVSLLSSFCNN